MTARLPSSDQPVTVQRPFTGHPVAIQWFSMTLYDHSMIGHSMILMTIHGPSNDHTTTIRRPLNYHPLPMQRPLIDHSMSFNGHTITTQ
eukprot:8785902-Lingulodinium_polyedra.AAC.1